MIAVVHISFYVDNGLTITIARVRSTMPCCYKRTRASHTSPAWPILRHPDAGSVPTISLPFKGNWLPLTMEPKF